MNNKILSAVLFMSFGLMMGALNPAFAVANRPSPRGFGEEVRERIASAPGVVKKLFKERVTLTGTVASISGATMTVTKDSKTYTIQTDGSTQFRRRFWGKGAMGEIQVGDTVNVTGKWTDDTQTTIQAKLVRDVSIQKFNGVFFGTIQSVTGSGWVMTTVSRGNQTVTVSQTTKFTDRKGKSLSQTDVAVGHKVRLRGLWDRKSNTITEVTQVKDFSLPLAPSPTPTPTPTP
jgi:hypothetical protein